MTANPNIGHFCDPEKDHLKDEKYTMAQGFPFTEHSWPKHESCSGKVIINSGLYNEQIVDCECSCHNHKEMKK